jgi:acyl-CoA thioester hydrolase
MPAAPETPFPRDADAPAPLPAPTRAIPTSGTSRIRVRYCECDPMGVAHHASYIPWLEIGRTEILRDCGVTYAQMEAGGFFLVIVKLDVRYRRPVRYDDLVEVRTRVSGGSRVKIVHEYDVVVVERDGRPTDEPAAAASTTLGCVGPDGRIRELPAWLAPSQ